MSDYFPSTPRTRWMRLIEQGKVTEFYEDCGAASFIGEIAVRRAGKLEVAATADRLEIPVIFDPEMIISGHYTSRLQGSGTPSIELNPRHSEDEIRWVFGHEVGHHYLEEVAQIWLTRSVHNDLSEVFCDVFGTEMAEPDIHPLAETERRAKRDYNIPDDYFAYIVDRWGAGAL